MENIKKSTLDFLNDLKNNNNRDWFIKNRSAYSEAKDNFESFIQEIINKIIDFEPIMKGLEVKSCIYRINRDIRFSNDKSPYKSHFGAYIVRGGKKNGDKFAGYYIHIEPGKSIIAGGAYMLPKPWLSAIREKIDEEPEPTDLRVGRCFDFFLFLCRFCQSVVSGKRRRDYRRDRGQDGQGHHH